MNVKPYILQLGLSGALIIGVAGSTYVATINKGFSEQYGRIVDSLVAGVLGAVAGGGTVAAVMSNTNAKPTRERVRRTTGPSDEITPIT